MKSKVENVLQIFLSESSINPTFKQNSREFSLKIGEPGLQIQKYKKIETLFLYLKIATILEDECIAVYVQVLPVTLSPGRKPVHGTDLRILDFRFRFHTIIFLHYFMF